MPEAKSKAEVDFSNEETTTVTSIDHCHNAEPISSGGAGPNASPSSIHPDDMVAEDDLDELRDFNPS